MYEVYCGNIGRVYESDSRDEANSVYDIYVGQSMDNYGRAAGENVTMFQDNEIVKEYYGSEDYAE